MTLIDILPRDSSAPDDIAVDMVLYEFELLQGKAALYQLAPDPAIGNYFAQLICALQPKMDAYASSKADDPEAARVRDQNLRLVSLTAAS